MTKHRHYLLGNRGAHLYNGNILQCEKCNRTYKSIKTLSNHKCAFCGRCQKVFSSYQKYKEHAIKCTIGTEEKVNDSKCIDSSVSKHLEPLKVTSEKKSLSSNPTYKFVPVDFSWQLQLCHELKLQVHCAHSFTTSSNRIGSPTSIKRIIGDGNCFFRSVSYILTGSEEYYALLRSQIVQHMINNPAFMERLLGQRDVQRYIHQSNMAINKTWATEIEIFTTAHMLKTDIYIYGKYAENRPWTWHKHSARIFQAEINIVNRNIYLQNTGQDHYDVVLATTSAASEARSLSSVMEENVLREVQKQVNLTSHKKSSSEKSMSSDRKAYKANWIAKKRANIEYRECELQREIQNKRKKRENEQMKEKEKKHKQEKRKCDTFREEEKSRKQEKRKSDSFREEENRRKQEKRKSDSFREEEKIHKREKRKSDTFREEEKSKKDKTKNRLQETTHKREKRKNKPFKEGEKRHKQEKRRSDTFREEEKSKKVKTRNRPQEMTHKQEKRKDKTFKEVEKRHKQEKRKSDTFREEEKSKKVKTKNRPQEMTHKQEKRRDHTLKENENRRKQEKRKDPAYRNLENVMKKKKQSSFQNMILEFHKYVEEGPLYICTCCDQLWYRKSVRVASLPKTVKQELASKCVTGVKSVKGKEWICYTCFNTLTKNKLPALSKANRVVFPQLPDCLKLTHLEERLVAARIPFMQLHELPRGGQFSIHGNVVNVPTNVTSTVNILPRNVPDENSIPLKLKRKLQYGHHYQFQTVRPTKIINAVKWLLENSEIYKEEGIVVNEEWETEFSEQLKLNTEDERVLSRDERTDSNQEYNDEETKNKEVGSADENKNHGKDITPTLVREESGSVVLHDRNFNCEYKDSARYEKAASIVKQNEQQSVEDSDAEWDERPPDDLPAGNLDTLLQPQDLLEESRLILSVAPGEGNHPLNIFIDKHSETLSFPCIYAGQSLPEDKERPTKLQYSDLCKSELRRTDRRVAGNIPNIFFKMKKLQMLHIKQKAQLCLRKIKGQVNYTAGQLKSQDFVQNLIHHNEGFRAFKDLRGSPPYWEKVKKDIFAIIRYLGIPTWFASFSSAETSWEHLLKILGQSVEKKQYTSEEVKKFTWHQKSQLIQKDPVTCVRHFEHQVQAFLHQILLNNLHPVGKVVDYFYKVEFQMRGSPHIHMLMWVEGAPKLDDDDEEVKEEKADEEDVIEFIDDFVTCAKSEQSGDLAKLQRHAHSRTCKKKGKNICRFNFP